MQGFIEIDLGALRFNFAAVRALCAPAGIIAVVKANAFGCGAPRCARLWLEEGASMLAVTRLEEAVELRQAGIEGPILLMAPPLPDEREAALHLDLRLAVTSSDEARAIDALAARLQRRARVHLKVNTGMNRFGVAPERTGETVREMRALANLEIEAAWTHLAQAASPDPKPSEAAWESLLDATFGLDLPLHICNSAAALRFESMRARWVRPGTVLYGQNPIPKLAPGVELRDPFRAVARVVAVRTLEAGQSVGYGAQWTAPARARVAVLGLGWADGLGVEPHARPQTPGSLLREALTRAARLRRDPLAGRRARFEAGEAPLVGRIAMHFCFADVSRLEGVEIGDHAVVPMRRVTAAAHLPRVYLNPQADDHAVLGQAATPIAGELTPDHATPR